MLSSTLKNIERELIATNCDYHYPIQLIHLEGGQEETIKWRHVQGYYPPQIRRMMKQLEKTLVKHQTTIIHH